MQPPASLHVQHLTKPFGGVRALSNVALQVLPDQVCGLIGPNGAGKTTLLNLVTGTQPATSGSISMGGQELRGLPAHRVAAHSIARTFQNIRLFPSMTVAESVRVAQTQLASRSPAGLLFLPPTRQAGLEAQARAALEMVGLWDDWQPRRLVNRDEDSTASGDCSCTDNFARPKETTTPCASSC